VVDASNVQPLGRGKSELSPESIQHIVKLVRSPDGSESGLVRNVSADELASNDFNLVPRRYVLTPEPTGTIFDAGELWGQIRVLDATARRTAAEMDALLADLAI
jgi:type I restriction-modification system DNA methylase subunit